VLPVFIAAVDIVSAVADVLSITTSVSTTAVSLSNDKTTLSPTVSGHSAPRQVPPRHLPPRTSTSLGQTLPHPSTATQGKSLHFHLQCGVAGSSNLCSARKLSVPSYSQVYCYFISTILFSCLGYFLYSPLFTSTGSIKQKL